jgi:hypothetical protein
MRLQARKFIKLTILIHANHSPLDGHVRGISPNIILMLRRSVAVMWNYVTQMGNQYCALSDIVPKQWRYSLNQP